MTEEILKRLDALSAKLGVAAATLWDAYLRQARIEGIKDLAWAGIWSVVTILCIFISRHGYQKWSVMPPFRKRTSDEDDLASCELVKLRIGGICAVIGALVALGFLSGAYDALANPVAYAFDLLRKAL